MHHFFYVLFLCFSILGIGLYDFKEKYIFFSSDRKRYGIASIITIALFLFIDILGVQLGIFSTNPLYVLGFFPLPGVPLEEFLFLSLIAYVSLVIGRKII